MILQISKELGNFCSILRKKYARQGSKTILVRFQWTYSRYLSQPFSKNSTTYGTAEKFEFRWDELFGVTLTHSLFLFLSFSFWPSAPHFFVLFPNSFTCDRNSWIWIRYEKKNEYINAVRIIPMLLFFPSVYLHVLVC